MDLTRVRTLATELLAEIEQPTLVPAGASLQSAIDAAPSGATLQLESGATYEGAILCTRPIQIVGRDPRSIASPVLTSRGDTATVVGPSVTFRYLTVRSENPDATLITEQGAGTLLHAVTASGDPVRGQHRGILAHGRGSVYRQCVVVDCFLLGRDAQAVAGWDGTEDLLIDGGYFSGGAETILFGGADSTRSDRIPKRLTVQNATLTKRPEWASKGVQVKCALELKAVQGFRMSRCLLEYAGTSEGQGGYLILLTVRNQDGRAPWSCVEDVVIEDTAGRHAGGCVNILGRDDQNPSGVARNITLRRMTFEDIDPRHGGAGRMFLIGDGPEDVTLEDLTVKGEDLAAAGYFYGAPPVRMALRRIQTPPSAYGWKVDGGGQGLDAVKAYAPDITIDGVTEAA